MELTTAKISRLYKSGLSVLEIYQTLKYKPNLTMKKIAKSLAKSEIIIETINTKEVYVVIPSKMNYSFRNKEKI